MSTLFAEYTVKTIESEIMLEYLADANPIKRNYVFGGHDFD